jgi:hypothetical protein
MLKQFSDTERKLIYTKISMELIIILVVVVNFYNGIGLVLFGICFLAYRLFQYNQKSIEDVLCL